MKKAVFSLLFMLTFISAFSVVVPTALATDSSSTQITVLPGSYKYPLKRLMEKVSLALTLNKTKKIEKLENFAQIRLGELDYVTENNKTEYIEESASRYSYYIGTLAQKTTEIQDAGKRESVRNLLSSHKEKLEIMRDRFPANTTYWLSVQQDIDSTKILSDTIK